MIKLPSIDSTNNYAMEMLSANMAYDGTLIITDHQLNGRGQRGASWIAHPGENLTFSIIYLPTFLAVERIFYLSVITSLGIIKTLEEYDLQGKIKWPNDIYIRDKKISGILIENSLNGVFLKHSIIGIGLNINQIDFEEIKATSIRSETGKHLDKDKILEQLIIHIERYYLQLKHGHYEELLKEYYTHMLYYRSTTELIFQGKLIEATILGVSPAGLLIFDHQGEQKSADLKQVVFTELNR